MREGPEPEGGPPGPGQRNAARAKTEGGALAKIDHGALASHAATAKALRQVPAEDCDTLFPAAGSLK